MRICDRCGIEKKLERFDGKRITCRDCRNVTRREFAAKRVKYVICKHCEASFKKLGANLFCSPKCKLLHNVKKENDCWIWQGDVTSSKYGKIYILKKHLSTHRLSYEVHKGKIPEGMQVCHSCDNRRCVNPDHLWVGTASDNMSDASRKGRLTSTTGRKWSEETRKIMKTRPHSDRRGEKHHLRKLKNEDVFEIRKLLDYGLTQTEIANKFKVQQSAINNIKHKKSWSHI